MNHLRTEKLQVTTMKGLAPVSVTSPRHYTLTHSDMGGDLFLSIGPHYDQQKLEGWQTRLMRDEVLAKWTVSDKGRWQLEVFCHVSGGLVVGTANWRLNIFQYHMPMVLEAFRFGDQKLFQAFPQLNKAHVIVHFQAKQAKYNRTEHYGHIGNYCLQPSVNSNPKGLIPQTPTLEPA